MPPMYHDSDSRPALYMQSSPAPNVERGMAVWGCADEALLVLHLGNKPFDKPGGYAGNLTFVIDGKQRYFKDVNSFWGDEIVGKRLVLFGKTPELALKFLAQYDFDFHTACSAFISLMKSSALVSLRKIRISERKTKCF